MFFEATEKRLLLSSVSTFTPSGICSWVEHGVDPPTLIPASSSSPKLTPEASTRAYAPKSRFPHADFGIKDSLRCGLNKWLCLFGGGRRESSADQSQLRRDEALILIRAQALNSASRNPRDVGVIHQRSASHDHLYAGGPHAAENPSVAPPSPPLEPSDAYRIGRVVPTFLRTFFRGSFEPGPPSPTPPRQRREKLEIPRGLQSREARSFAAKNWPSVEQQEWAERPALLLAAVHPLLSRRAFTGVCSCQRR